MMKIALIGSGNTAANTLLQLLAIPAEREIAVVARNRDRALAALMDAASAFPEAARFARVGALDDIPQADIVVICAGIQMGVNDTPKFVLEQNARIVSEYLEPGLSADASVIVVGTPVDDLTVILGGAALCDKRRVIGFGGDLDTSRLRYVLANTGLQDEAGVVCVGEHGSRTVPVYNSERNYDDVAAYVRGSLKEITRKAGPPRNLATGVWLSNLITHLSGTAGQNVVCGYHDEHSLYLTWPRQVTSEGLGPVQDVTFGPSARLKFEELLAKKRAEEAGLRQLASDLFRG